MRGIVSRIMHATWLSLLCATPLFAQDATPAYVDAVWKPQNVVFSYRSEGRTYSCAVLEHKIMVILRRLGANERLALRRNGCRDLAGLARFEAKLESPVAATAENLRSIATYDSRDELVARVQGASLPSAADLLRFPAVWRTVSFRRDRGLDIDAGDCALVQQLRRQVLPLMSVRVIRDIRNTDCVSEMSGIVPPTFDVIALVPADR